jgi:DNA-binding MarR family transcriptional regulator
VKPLRNVTDAPPEYAFAAGVMEMGFGIGHAMRHRRREESPAGLTVGQFRTLFHLHYSPDASVSDVARHLGQSLASASRLVESLVREGHVTRVQVPGNRRRLRIRLTDAGEAVLGEFHNDGLAHLAERLSALSAEEAAVVRAAATALRRIFATDADFTGEEPPPPRLDDKECR